MDASHLEIAAELCALVGSDDLLTYLGLGAGCPADEARAALKKKRGFFQSMQGNPKYGEVARFFIKHYRALDELLADPAAYAASARSERSHAQLPMLEMVIDSVLADGVLTTEEEAFVRESASNLGIAPQLYEEVLRRRCVAAGVPIPAPAPPPAPIARSVSPSIAPIATPRRHRGSAGAGWWDDSFGALLQQAVPDDTRRLVDLATNLGWGALALLPDRPGLEYLGIDRDAARLQVAERAIRNSPVGGRVALLHARPEELPIPDDAVDVVLAVRALDRDVAPRQVLAEAARVLRPGGRLICVEPDTASTSVWFDGPLREVEVALRALVERVDGVLAGELPSDEAPGQSLGPRLADRLTRVGLRPAEVHLHPVREARLEDMESFAERLTGRVEKLALLGQLGGKAPEVVAAIEAIDAAEARIGSAAVGLAATLVPLFLVVGTKR